MIESPTETIYVQAENLDDPDSPLLTDNEKSGLHLKDAEILLVKKEKPITARFCTTIRHLRARAGIWSRFRGLTMWSFMHFFAFNIHYALSFWVPALKATGLATFLTVLIMNSYTMAWTQIVISESSPLPWYKRFPTFDALKKTVPASAIYAGAHVFCWALPRLAVIVFELDQPMHMLGRTGENSKLDPRECQIVMIKAFAVGIIALASAVLLLVPAKVTLTRVYASLLQEDIETIVPFDRSFGGKVVPAIIGGSGAIGELDAWKTFDWSARLRLLGVYVKVFFMQTAVSIGFMGLVLCELRYFMGDNFDVLVASAHENMKKGMF